MSKYDSRNKPIREHRIGLEITQEDNYICLRTKKGYVFKTYYEKELFELLATNRVGWDCNVNSVVRLQYEVSYRHKTCEGVMRKDLAWLIWGYYHYGVRKNNLCTTLKNMQRELNGACIDHIDNDRTNNCISNLTVTSRATNTHKGQTFDNLTQEPYKLIMANKDNKFKACLFWLASGFVFVNPIIIANSLESLLTTVKLYMKARPFNSYGSVIDNFDRDKAKRISETERANDIELQRILFDNFDNSLVGFKIACAFVEQRGLAGKVTIVKTTQMYNTD